MLRLARAGAQARVIELRQELESLYRSFPDLRGGGRAPRHDSAGVRKQRSPRGAARKARGWTAAQRRAVAERMKRYWAARRANQKK